MLDPMTMMGIGMGVQGIGGLAGGLLGNQQQPTQQQFAPAVSVGGVRPMPMAMPPMYPQRDPYQSLLAQYLMRRRY